MLDYVLMLSNVGPPALTLSAIATMCVHFPIPVMPIASSLHPLYHNFCPTTKFDGLIPSSLIQGGPRLRRRWCCFTYYHAQLRSHTIDCIAHHCCVAIRKQD